MLSGKSVWCHQTANHFINTRFYSQISPQKYLRQRENQTSRTRQETNGCFCCLCSQSWKRKNPFRLKSDNSEYFSSRNHSVWRLFCSEFNARMTFYGYYAGHCVLWKTNSLSKTQQGKPDALPLLELLFSASELAMMELWQNPFLLQKSSWTTSRHHHHSVSQVHEKRLGNTQK